ncbi:MAG: hypothetical protein E5X49_10610 [Mesorhizobium sp.]|uniref:hypothetical protein n=1 Tax=Mesorhizobium sp. TaxID=1871066 RepID=UPI000FE37882|nr:hypothetical protein [Mesorhizobium sp.]RWK02082.1 MAG: hypothetical protein EOR42_20670 [Mesorhizobium sp.]RWK20363.1 MAG: hypothetical protein EOR43_21430 [Mesorhizobium sp.]RWK29026.1 MAG: hypothetical protein EOR44_21180 [Mesorhizobium sp.]TIQ43511.1 MAG: hypothetical protein E5X49_10610 [Mesorhizobium sp.]
MNKLMENAAVFGKKYAHALAAIALVSMVSGCQTMDTARTGSISGNKPTVNALGKKLHYVNKKRLYRVHRRPLTQTTSVTRVREEAYAAFVRPQRIHTSALTKVSYNIGSPGPLLGHSPWICGPSGFGQRSACRAR